MSHNTEKKYFELFALKLLEKYINMDIKKFEDKEEPDWQNDIIGVGIEVTRNSLGTKFWRELENVHKPISYKQINKFNKRFEKNGGRVINIKQARIIFQDKEVKDGFGLNEKYFYILPVYNDNFSEVNNSIEDKLDKLNKHYNKKLQDNRLFIFTPIYIRKEMIEDEVIKINNIQEGHKRKFDTIYICTLNGLYILDLKNDNWEFIQMEREDFDQISMDASKEVKIVAG